MTDENPSITNHVSIGVSDPSVSHAFCDAVLGTIGAKRVHEDGDTVAYGKMFPEFWVGTPLDRGAPITANGVHFAFFASSTEQVDVFYRVALEYGAVDDRRRWIRSQADADRPSLSVG